MITKACYSPTLWNCVHRHSGVRPPTRHSEIWGVADETVMNKELLKEIALYVFFSFQVTDFVERLMKHASNGEVLLFKQPLDKRLHQLLSYTPELNLASLTELEFISNFQAIQVQKFLSKWWDNSALGSSNVSGSVNISYGSGSADP